MTATNSRPVRRTRPNPVHAALVLALALACHAAAQIRPTTPWLAALRDGAPLISGVKGGHPYYEITRLAAGQVVLVSAEGDGWAEIAYPQAVDVLVDADDVTVVGNTVRLRRPSRLRAPSQAGLKGSWKALFDQPLPTGTTLALRAIDAVVEDGRRAYFVAPPEGARAYVKADTLRRATETEIAAYQAAGGRSTGALAAADPTTPPESAQQPTTDPTTRTEPDQPVRVDQRRAASVEILERAFETVRAQPIIEAEFDSLIAEFERAIERLPDQPGSEGLRARLGQRVEMLKLGKEMQATRRAFLETRAERTAEDDRLAQLVEAARQVSAYTIVGRLSASPLYDGQRMPLMYRVQALGPVPRTIGYIAPVPGIDLAPMLGEVVGIVGEARLDVPRGMTVIDARRVAIVETD